MQQPDVRYVFQILACQ